MATEIRVPTLGESVSEATIGRWFKKPGDPVKADEPVLELETDKVTLEVPAPASGTLGDIVAKDGETVSPGAVLGSVIEGGAAAAAPAPAPKAEAPKAAAPAPAPAAAPVPAPAAASRDNGPAVTRLAAESGVSPAGVAGSGKDGRVTKGDMLAAIATGGAAAPAPAAPVQVRAPSAPVDAEREERVKMTKLRQTIARRLKDAQNSAAMLTTFNDVDMSAVMNLRSQYKDVFEKKHGIKLGFMGFFTKAVIQALKDVPAVNAEIDGQDMVYKNYYHIGIAVGTEKGLVVPVVRDADLLSSRRHREDHRRFRQAARATASSPSTRCRAAPSPSPMAASTARSCRRRSSTPRNRASSACTASRTARWSATARSSCAR